MQIYIGVGVNKRPKPWVGSVEEVSWLIRELILTILENVLLKPSSSGSSKRKRISEKKSQPFGLGEGATRSIPPTIYDGVIG